MFQLGFDSDAFGLVFTSDYKAKVLASQEGKETQGTVERFLERVLPACTDLSFNKDQMLKEFLFTDSSITYGWNCSHYFFMHPFIGVHIVGYCSDN